MDEKGHKHDWNNEEMTARFEALWDDRPRSGLTHTAQAWNKRAVSWNEGLKNDSARKERSRRRVADTVRYLSEHDVLVPGTKVVDIGCGLGRFTTEFAKCVAPANALGLDVSPQMIDFAREYAQSECVPNAVFKVCDFKESDIDAEGWRESFDLVFTSITPAVSTRAQFEKASAMSRAWCFSSNFCSYRDTLTSGLIAAEKGLAANLTRYDGRSSYAMFNLLWLEGLMPYVYYFSENQAEITPATWEKAAELAADMAIDPSDRKQVDMIYRYLSDHADPDGIVRHTSTVTYIWMLWNVRVKR